MTDRCQTGPRILAALSDGPLKDDDIALRVGCSWLGVGASIRSLISDGTVRKVMGKPGFYRLAS